MATKRRRIGIETSPEAEPKKTNDNNKAVANGSTEEERQQQQQQQHNGNNESETSAGEELTKPLTVYEKEQRLVELRKLLPEVNDLQAQEVLVRADWIVEKARKTLAESSSSSSENDKSLNSSGEIFDTVEDYKKSKRDNHQHRHRENGTSTSTSKSSSGHHHHHHSSSSSSSKSKHHKSTSSRSSSSSGGHRSSSDKLSPIKHSSSSVSTSTSSSSHHKGSSSSSSSHHHKSPSKSHHHHHHSSSSSKDKEKRRSGEDKDQKNGENRHRSTTHSSSKKSHHKDKEKEKSRSSHEDEKRKQKLQPIPSDPDSDNDDDMARLNQSVYDSDLDSGDDSNFVETKPRKMVLSFLNEASQSQLTSIKTCSVKKADLLLQLRPFTSWRHLVQTVDSSKGLGHEVLNNCQELLQRRQKMSVLLKKCKKIICNLEKAAIKATTAIDGPVEQPKLLCPEMRLADYQLIGLNWLTMMHREGFNGILADEMGLGKTIQVIAFLTHLKEQRLSTVPHVIVVPSSTMDNWDNEMAKWSPQLVVAKYYGSQEERRALRISFGKAGGLKGVDVILTTYHTVAASPEERKMFRTIVTDYVVFDEAHMLKNMTTQRYEYLSKINANRRLLLTGTPLQNNLMELMSLLCFVMPKLFSGSVEDFKTLFQKGGKQPKCTEVTADGEPVTSFEQSQIEQAKLVMKPFVLRRLKKDVLQCLPPKSSTVVTVKMSAAQAERYTDLVEHFRAQRDLMENDTSAMTVMMEMRKLTNHPLLLRDHFTDERLREMAKRLATDLEYKKENAEYIFEDLAVMSDYQVYQLAQKYTVSGGSNWNLVKIWF